MSFSVSSSGVADSVCGSVDTSVRFLLVVFHLRGKRLRRRCYGDQVKERERGRCLDGVVPRSGVADSVSGSLDTSVRFLLVVLHLRWNKMASPLLW